jgi:hypothetical protein
MSSLGRSVLSHKIVGRRLLDLLTIAGVAEVGQASHALKDDFSVPHDEPHGALAGPETAQRRPAPNRKKLPF